MLTSELAVIVLTAQRHIHIMQQYPSIKYVQDIALTNVVIVLLSLFNGIMGHISVHPLHVWFIDGMMGTWIRKFISFKQTQ